MGGWSTMPGSFFYRMEPMQRRTFIKIVTASVVANTLPGMEGFGLAAQFSDRTGNRPVPANDDGVTDRLVKARFFDHAFDDDLMVAEDQIPLLVSSLARMKRVQQVIGHGNFCLLGFDDAIKYARNYSRIGRFTKAELEFLDGVFHSPAREYGFYGEKNIQTITGRIKNKQVKKIPRTGNYLYRGKPMEMYHDIQKKIGPDVVLTSGVRGVMKQFLLFLNKANLSKGNLSMASRSLAPPGYSYHGVGDFDVGKKGFGKNNFTEKFTKTRVYDQLADMGYIRFRYDRENDLGVRFEPWHVEVA